MIYHHSGQLLLIFDIVDNMIINGVLCMTDHRFDDIFQSSVDVCYRLLAMDNVITINVSILEQFWNRYWQMKLIDLFFLFFSDWCRDFANSGHQ